MACFGFLDTTGENLLDNALMSAWFVGLATIKGTENQISVKTVFKSFLLREYLQCISISVFVFTENLLF